MGCKTKITGNKDHREKCAIRVKQNMHKFLMQYIGKHKYSILALYIHDGYMLRLKCKCKQQCLMSTGYLAKSSYLLTLVILMQLYQAEANANYTIHL